MSVVQAFPIRGHDAWRRTLEVRERYLAAGDADRLPPPGCGVRREIVMSWRRSMLSGVDTAGTDLPRDRGAVPPARLVRAARPVLDRLAAQIAGTQAWAFLADRECRLVSYVVGDPGLTPLLEERGAFPGARFGEDVVGTNGLGTAVEQQRPFIVAGSEHFRAYESEATTAGARNRPGRLPDAGLADVDISLDENPVHRWITPEDAGAVVVRAIKRGDLYALTHPDWYPMVRQRHETIAAAFRNAAGADQRT